MIAFIIGVHLIVILLCALSSKIMLMLTRSNFVKARSLAALLTSAGIFVLYFVALGLVLKEFGKILFAAILEGLEKTQLEKSFGG
jgi:hypothetical protein